MRVHLNVQYTGVKQMWLLRTLYFLRLSIFLFQILKTDLSDNDMTPEGQLRRTVSDVFFGFNGVLLFYKCRKIQSFDKL